MWQDRAGGPCGTFKRCPASLAHHSHGPNNSLMTGGAALCRWAAASGSLLLLDGRMLASRGSGACSTSGSAAKSSSISSSRPAPHRQAGRHLTTACAAKKGRRSQGADGSGAADADDQQQAAEVVQANNPTEERRLAKFRVPRPDPPAWLQPGRGEDEERRQRSRGAGTSTSGRSGRGSWREGSWAGVADAADAGAPWQDGQVGGEQQERLSRYRMHDKRLLNKDQAADIARRLRQPGAAADDDNDDGDGGSSAAGRQRPLRVFRYGVDDLRLYKALDVAGLEGQVVVVDQLDQADAVVATSSKRGGKGLDLTATRRAAAAAGVPLLALRAVSAVALLRALGPLLGFGEAEVAARAATAGGARGNAITRAGASLVRVVEAEGDGAEQLLALLHGRGGRGAAAWLAARVATMEDPLGWVVRVDVEDDRADAAAGRQLTDLAAARYPLRRPLRHGSRLEKRRLLKDRAEINAPW